MNEPKSDETPPPAQGSPLVGPREWPPSEMRWPPPPGSEEPSGAERPAPWTALVLVVLIALLVQIAGAVLLQAWTRVGEHAGELAELDGLARLARVVELPGGLEVLVLGVQLPLLAFALLLVSTLPGGPWHALGLRAPDARAWHWGVALLGTLVVQQTASRALSAPFDPPEHLELLQQGLLQRPLWVGALLAVAAPALCEELFFRGWLQRRLRVAWGGSLSVLLSGTIFAAYHWDPVHVLGVLPIGLWIAWWGERSRSTWLPIACHAANNAFALTLVHLGFE
ncbi:MAG: CPBP family intramembrane metalloprotease [Planctomycetes bacterium]|nr:CPBP family intramembrane metalloprotease [Planctomycetota bacterium]